MKKTFSPDGLIDSRQDPVNTAFFVVERKLEGAQISFGPKEAYITVRRIRRVSPVKSFRTD